MTFEYYTTCRCCGNTEGVEMRRVGKEAEMPLCDDCAEIHEGFAERAGKGAKIQQAEDKLIGVIRAVDNSKKIILDLCGGTGSWSLPYAEAGYDVRIIDIKNGKDVRLFKQPKEQVYGILAAPDCTHFSGSGARHWAGKDQDGRTLYGLSVADACLRIINACNPTFWCLENPVGRLKWWIGDPVFYFNPCDYGDPYTKKTCLWGRFNIPLKNPVEPTEGSKMWRMYGGKSERTKTLRSITPPGFAKAFFDANQ